MRLPIAVALLTVAAACGGEPAPAPRGQSSATQSRPVTSPTSNPSPRGVSAPERPRGAARTSDATDVVRHYYELIGKRRFSEAWALRVEGGVSESVFARSYGAFKDYRATVGPSSEPQRAGEFEFVEVPVQIYGQRADGKPFGSAGTITLRRAPSSPNADRRSWRIYTSG